MARLLAVLIPLAVLVAAVSYLDVLTEPDTETVEVRAQAAGGPRTVLLRADSRGHFLIEATVNARAVRMLADTGATSVALTETDARRIGFSPASLAYNVPVQTANGRAFAASVTLDTVAIEGIVLRDVPALVAEAGVLDTSLLGMSFLGRLGNVTMSGDTLKLVE